MDKEKILDKAKAILTKREETLQHKQICLEADICPECGVNLESMVVTRFWNADQINTFCSDNTDHYDEVKSIDVMDH